MTAHSPITEAPTRPEPIPAAEWNRARTASARRLRQNRWLRAGAHHATLFLGSVFPEALPFVYVMGYPKSGTTWVCQLAGDYLQVPFPRWFVLPLGCAAVVHGHQTVRPSFRRAIYVARDGRDVMVSLFYYMARRLEPGRPVRGRLRRWFSQAPTLDDLGAALPEFIERQMRRPFATSLNWSDHVRAFLDAGRPDVPLMKYEELLADTRGALSRAMETLTGAPADTDRVGWAVEKFTFTRQSGRSTGSEERTHFLRKGTAGDWRRHYTREAAEIFDRFAGDALIALGYESDRSWAAACRGGDQAPGA